MDSIATLPQGSSETRLQMKRDDQSICKNAKHETRVCQKIPFRIFPAFTQDYERCFDVIARAPKKCWCVINVASQAGEGEIPPQCLHYDMATLWMTKYCSGESVFFIKERTPFTLLYAGRTGERPVLTIERRNTAVKITKKGNLEIAVESELLGEKNNNQVIIHTRRARITVDGSTNLMLEHCSDIYVPDVIHDAYDVVGLMSQTQLSRVYKIKKREGGEMQVMKVQVQLSEKQSDDVILNEVAILKQIKHDNIIKLITADTTSLQQYLIVEHASGGDLTQFKLKNENRTEANAKIIFKQVLSGLHYLHQNRIVHRDIKSKNIVIMSTGSSLKAKIIDFGLSCALPEQLKLTSVAGTYIFMSPIMLGNFLHDWARGYSEKTDIFSFGITLYLFLTREFPFDHHKDLYLYHREMMEENLKTKIDGFQSLSIPTQLLLVGCLEIRECLRPDAETLLEYEMWMR